MWFYPAVMPKNITMSSSLSEKTEISRSGPLHYMGAIAIVMVFGLLQWWLIQSFNLKMTFLMFFPAIMIGAWYGGWRPGALATLLSGALADYYFLEPIHHFLPLKDHGQIWTLLIFIAEGFFISALCEARLHSRWALLEERTLLEGRVQERTREISAANVQLAAQVAEREQAQIALSESESKFRSVVETASDAIVMSDADGNIVFWNRGACEMFGYDDAEVLHKPVVILIPEEFQEAHTRAMKRLQEGAAPRLLGRPLELRGRHRDDSEFPLELSLTGWRMGEEQFYSGIMRDLTQRKQAEEDRMHLAEEIAARAELEVAEGISRFMAQAMKRLTASLDETTIVRILADLCAPALGNGCVVDLVQTTEITPHTPLDELRNGWRGANLTLHRAAVAGLEADVANHDVFYEAPDATIQFGPWRALSTGKTEVLRAAEIEPLTQVGAAFEAWRDHLSSENAVLMCVPLIARGQALGVLTVISSDAAHNLDEAKASIIEDLARNAALMIDNARLLSETQTANRAKDEFLAVLSHELRTPLTAILGWVQLLKGDGLDDDTTQRALEIIERNTNAQGQLIEDLLDLSRIISGKLRLELHPIDLEPSIQGALDAVRPAMKVKEIELTISVAPVEGVVMGDAHRLQQVLWNLLANAVKFTSKGGRIEVSMQQFESFVEITVSDSGRGISAEFLPYVFDRFRQADSSSTRQHGGLGLGLAIVRHVTELHGGSVQATSDGPERGATFKISLPVASATQNAAGEETENAENHMIPATDSAHLLSNMRVLLVDDEYDTREMFSAALRRYGAQVKTCATVREALATLPTWQPRVVVSDIGMPDEDGYELIRQVRALPADQGGDVPAMALTAYARSTDRERTLEAGFNIHVAKPVDPYTLASLVAELGGEK